MVKDSRAYQHLLSPARRGGRRVILQRQAPGEGRHSLCCGLECVTGQKGKVGWSDASSSAVTGAEESERSVTLVFTRDPSETNYGRILETDYGTWLLGATWSNLEEEWGLVLGKRRRERREETFDFSWKQDKVFQALTVQQSLLWETWRDWERLEVAEKELWKSELFTSLNQTNKHIDEHQCF